MRKIRGSQQEFLNNKMLVCRSQKAISMAWIWLVLRAFIMFLVILELDRTSPHSLLLYFIFLISCHKEFKTTQDAFGFFKRRVERFLPGHLWWSPLLVFHFIHGPDSTFDVLHSHKALVQTQVMAHSILGKKKSQSKKTKSVQACRHAVSPAESRPLRCHRSKCNYSKAWYKQPLITA